MEQSGTNNSGQYINLLKSKCKNSTKLPVNNIFLITVETKVTSVPYFIKKW